MNNSPAYTLHCDLAIIGSGFAGSLLAMIARRQGRTVVMLERARHPRFVIGESSTPLGNLLLEELADRYDLPAVRTLSKWGTWQRSHPEVGCGLKRGFSFLHHRWGERGGVAPDHADQLLVAASPRDEVADTHWYRPDFDLLLAQEAERLGAIHLQGVQLDGVVFDGAGGTLSGEHEGRRLEVRAGWVVDGSGPRGFLFRMLGLGERALEHLPRTQGLYSHFRGVRRVEDLPGIPGGLASADRPPYPIDDAALHHVFPGGWIWVLRFNQGIASAGVAATDAVADELGFAEGEAGWRRLLERLPLVREQFEGAEATMPFVHAPRLSFRANRLHGDRWVMLPYAGGFIDPLLSAGFPLTLLGVGRLAQLMERGEDRTRLGEALKDYEAATVADFEAAEALVGALYSTLDDFEVFTRLTLLYFAAAMFSETWRRLGRTSPSYGFLLHDHPSFGPALRELTDAVTAWRREGPLAGERRKTVMEGVLRAIAPVDVGGLARQDRRRWYPVDLEDLFAASGKLGATQDELRGMLRRCGLV